MNPIKTLSSALVSNLLLVISLWSPIASADDKPPKFQVEIVVFETLALKGWTEEFWSDNLDIPDLSDQDTLSPPIVDPKYFILKDEVNRMTPQMGYHIIYHQAWVVDALPQNESKPIAITMIPDSDNQSRLDGSLIFYKSRYPHIELDLQLERKIPLVIRSDFAKNQNIQEDLLPEFWRFELKESRKINTGQIHYLDHPIFGALVEIKYLPNYSEADHMTLPPVVLPPVTLPDDAHSTISGDSLSNSLTPDTTPSQDTTSPNTAP